MWRKDHCYRPFEKHTYVHTYCDETAEFRNSKAVIARQREGKRVSVDINSQQYEPFAVIRRTNSTQQYKRAMAVRC